MNWKSLIGITYLANAELDCPTDQFLTGFQFENLTNKRKFKYNFECYESDSKLGPILQN